jgi:acyl dehydratase
MTKWDIQLYFEDVVIDADLGPVSIPLTLQQLVMEAGANRDFSSIHHDREAAKATGAPEVYANTYLIMGMIERLLREWIGLKGQIKKLGPMRMKMFNCVGDTLTLKGRVREKREDGRLVYLHVTGETENGETVNSKAIVSLPSRNVSLPSK